MFGIEGFIGNARRHRALAHYGIGPQRCGGESHPVGVLVFTAFDTQGCATLHPGLWSMAPLGPTGDAR
jgi:hypothetical protein